VQNGFDLLFVFLDLIKSSLMFKAVLFLQN